jgi:predicted RNA-binding Zn ribbon-like protein
MSSRLPKAVITPRPFFMIANQPALDLANTLAADGNGPVELIPDFDSFCEWLARVRLVTPKQSGWLSKRWSKRQRASFLKEIKAYRALIKDAAESLQKEGKVPPIFVQETNRMLSAAGAVIGIQSPAKDVYAASWPVDWDNPKAVLGVIAEQGMRFICNCDPSRVRKCDNPACALVFYDMAKNNRRRWCSMDQCGNRQKVALHRKRAKQSKKK